MRIPGWIHEVLMWVCSLSLTAVAVRGHAGDGKPPIESEAFPDAPATRGLSSDALARMLTLIQDTDPFHLNDAATATPQSPSPDGSVQDLRPTLVVRGIVGGPPWSAVLLGLPGRVGAVVAHTGDVFPPYRVQRIGRNTVELAEGDSIIRLALDTKRAQ